jgi:hypothetical protein
MTKASYFTLQNHISDFHHRLLGFTIGIDAGTIKKFDIFRKKRNSPDYERPARISEREVEEIRLLAEKLKVDFDTWILRAHPHLKP